MRRMVKDAQSAEPAPPPVPAADAQKKNPVKPTPDGLAEAKKLYGYHCAMCHGKDGDGKGDLAAQMKLELNDWPIPAPFPNSRMANSFTSSPMAGE
jgi:mono/diheme cytochrome c family protein